MTSYNIYFKPTTKCNLKCSHCYLGGSGKLEMSRDDVDRSIQWINNFVNEHKDDVVTVILHGGEPTLYDIDLLFHIVQSINRVKWSITTNLVYHLTDHLYSLFDLIKQKDTSFVIQTSWDYKIRFKGNQLQTWETNVTNLINRQFVVQPTVCLTSDVVNQLKSEQIYRYFLNLGVSRLNFERITDTGNALHNNVRPTNLELNKWAVQAYKQHKIDNVYIPLFESIEQSLNGHLLGCRARRCTQTVITINSDGTIGTCPNISNLTVGNINTNEISNACLIEQERAVKQRCLLCEYYSYCNGDCFQLEQNKDDTFCHGLKMVYDYIVYGENDGC